MARYDHLQLLRLPERFQRRKAGGGGPPPPRDPNDHSRRLREELDTAIASQQARRRPEFVDPSLILRVQMSGALLEEQWNVLGLTVLSSDEDRTLVLFSSRDDMAQFRERLAAYGRGAPVGQINPPYAAFIGGIETISAIAPRDRIGVRAREEGFVEPADFEAQINYTLDLELWDLGRRELRLRKLEQITDYVVARGGEALDRYVGPSISMLRLSCSGAVIATLLGLEDVAELDLPPSPDLTTGTMLNLELPQLPPLGVVDPAAPLIGVIDSGINAHPLIDDILVGAIGVPDALGTADEWGHGTRVAGVSIFGDLRGQLEAGTLDRGARLCSAKVLNERGEFPDRRLTPGLMREAITRLHAEFGCRIFVIALGDRKKIYDGGKVGPWAATLDELVAELDVVIIVSAGNRVPRSGNRLEQAVTEYPGYLLESTNRLCEPAGAMNVVTVGALAHGHGVGPDVADSVGVRPITIAGEPSPFTRVGPGIGGSLKPDLIDVGGTLIYDPIVARLRGGEDVVEAGVLSLHHRFIDRLFSGNSGTSFAAPLVAYKASQIMARFPYASANLIRALLAGSARAPAEAQARLLPLGQPAVQVVCGHGQPDLEHAMFSDDARVVLYTEDELAIDHFAVYQVPIPPAYQATAGRRSIRVTLAYDPPVRHSRRDYAGVNIGFRLIRGCDPDLIFEHYRKRAPAEGAFPDIAGRYDCKLTPSSTLREKSTLQSATVTFSRDVAAYGDTYHLVVRCGGGWADIPRQSFALTVEIAHEADIQLYERLRQRVQVRT